MGVALFAGVSARAQALDSSVRERIYTAARMGNTAELKRLASLGYSLELTDESGNTPYCQAVWSQDRVAVATLIDAGVNVRPSCLKRIPYVTETRIYAAAHAEDLDQLVAWKKEGLNVDVVNPKTGNSALCEAVYNYDCPAIQTLLRAGSQQAQPCMRRVPQEVRENLQCRPLKIDWGTIGYTVLGAGMAGALVAILASGGSSGSPTCPATQRWKGDRCVSCDTCWIGNTCVSSTEMKKKPYYRDETNAECWVVSPPPVSLTEKQLDRAVTEIEDDSKYKDGKYQPMINAATAYARGYSGYIVERTSPYGRPSNGTVNTPAVSKNKITVAVYSTGMAIGKGGSVTETTTNDTTSSTQTTNVWDWSNVHRGFYNSAEKDKDGAAKVSEMTYKDGNNSITGKRVAKVGAVQNNFAVDSTGQPYGYNYDYGPCTGDNEENCYSGVVKEIGGNNYGLAVVYEGTTQKYVLLNTTTGQVVGFTEDEPTNDTLSKYARWSGLKDSSGNDVSEAGGSINGDIFSKYAYYNYADDVAYEYDENNPSPHYKDATGEDSIGGSLGTFLAGIVGAMKLDDPNTATYGVAYNTSILPVNRDVVRGLSYNAMQTMVSNADVLLLAEGLNISNTGADAWKQTALGAFDVASGTYTAKEISDVLGSDAENMYKLLSKDKVGKIAVVPTGSGQIWGSWDIKHPTIQAVVPLMKGMNSSTVWNSTSRVLPTVDATNPLYHLYIAVASVDPISSSGERVRLSPTSQPCGIAGSYCVVAPGGQSGSSVYGLYSTVDPVLTNNQNSYGYQRSYGTSSAAATVAGAVAVLMGAYPHLTPQQVVEILFQTSTYITPTDADITSYGDTYAVGSDKWGDYNSIYGRGLINLAAATQPIGGKEGLWVYKSSSGEPIRGETITASATHLTSPATMALSQSLASALPTNFVAFDAYNRPFTLSTAGLFQLKNRRKMKSWDDFKMFMRGRDPVKVQATENFSMMYRDQTSRVTSSSSMPMGLMQINLKQDKMRYSLFYSQDTTMGREAYWKRRLSNPFIQMRDAYGVETGYDLNSKWSVEVGWTMGKNGFFDDDDRHFDAPDNKMQAFTSSIVFKPIDKMAFKVATGVMKETGSSLGMVSEGAFNIKGANTHFVGAGVVFTPMDKVRLEAMYYYGQTKTSSNGGLMNLSRMTSDSFAVTASYQPTDDHLFGLQVSSPLRVRKGSLNVSLPVGRHPTEDIYYYDTYKANMKPKARELDVSMYYQGNVTDEISLQSEMGVRLNPDHQSDVVPDYRGMVGVKWEY